MNITKQKVVDSVFKNYKSFFINIGNYRDISVQTRQLFTRFLPVKFWSRERTPPNSVCIKHLQAPILCPNFSFARQVVVAHIYPPVTGQRQILSIGRSAHFSSP